MLIREGRPDDWENVAELLAQLGRPDVRRTAEEDATRLVFESYLRRSEVVALVAEVDGRVVGFLAMEYRVRLNFTAPQAWIPDLIVEEDSRSRGIGQALLARAEDLARRRGCWGMSLDSANWRRASHAFYERQGWEQTSKGFTKLLVPGVTWPPRPDTDR